MLLQERDLFTEKDVIFVQCLLKQAECEDLYEKCYQYAKKQRVLCFYEKPPDDGFTQVSFHVNVSLEEYSPEEIQEIKDTVIAFLGCEEDEVYIQRIERANSFIIVLAIKQKYSSKIAHFDLQHIQKLSDLKVDYFDFEKERYTTEEHLRNVSLPHKTGFSATHTSSIPATQTSSIPATQISSITATQIVSITATQTSSITVPGVDSVGHISAVTSDRLWVSDWKGRLLQMDSIGHVLHDKQRTGSWRTGNHTVTEDGDLLFIDNRDKVCKLTSDRTVTTLLTTYWGALCIHSSRINGDILVGSYWRVKRYGRTGRELQTIEKDDKGQSLYGSPWYITENRNGDILISDMGKRAVIVVDESGRHRFDYKGRQSEDTIDPNGLCTDDLGHVLVCTLSSVHLLDQDGQFLFLLLTREKHGLRAAIALCMDDQHNLYLGQYGSNTINVYKLNEIENLTNIKAHYLSGVMGI